MPTQEQRSQATRMQLLRAFRSAFLKHGYGATTTSGVLTQTGLSKGALYHHFRSKADIMRALYEAESQGVFDRARRQSSSKGTQIDQLVSLYLAWMEETRKPSTSKMLFEIGPGALGPQSAKDIEDRIARPFIEHLLEEAIHEKEIGSCDTTLMATLLNALVGEAALYRLRTGQDTAPALKLSIDAVLTALRKSA